MHIVYKVKNSIIYKHYIHQLIKIEMLRGIISECLYPFYIKGLIPIKAAKKKCYPDKYKHFKSYSDKQNYWQKSEFT